MSTKEENSHGEDEGITLSRNARRASIENLGVGTFTYNFIVN